MAKLSAAEPEPEGRRDDPSETWRARASGGEASHEQKAARLLGPITGVDAVHTLHGMTGSGNCYKPALLMRQLGIPYRWVEVDLLKGGTRTPEFLAKNPNGKVPTLQTPEGRCLAESNAILFYLAEGSAMLPADHWQRAKVLEWLFFEQYSHEPYIATVRFWVYYLKKEQEWAQKIADARPKGYAALGVMEKQLATSPWLVNERYSIADIALFAYTHVAEQGRYDLAPYPGVRAWLERVATQPGFVSMEQISASDRAA